MFNIFYTNDSIPNDSFPLAIITRDETREHNQLEDTFKIFTPSEIVVYISKTTLLEIIDLIEVPVRVPLTQIDDLIAKKMIEAKISEDRKFFAIEIFFAYTAISCSFALDVNELCIYREIYLHEDRVKDALEDTTPKSVEYFIKGETVTC